jgi:anti-sigma B factor antagonist
VIKQRFTQNVLIVEIPHSFSNEPELSLFDNLITEQVRNGQRSIIVDLCNVDWMNSLGLGHIMAAVSSLRGKDGDVKLARPSEKVAHLLELTSLNLVIDIYDEIEAAIADFQV